MRALTTEKNLLGLVPERPEPSRHADMGEVEVIGQAVYPGPAS